MEKLVLTIFTSTVIAAMKKLIFLEVLTHLSWKCSLSTCLCTENWHVLEPNRAHLFVLSIAAFTAMEELNNCNRTHMANKA